MARTLLENVVAPPVLANHVDPKLVTGREVEQPAKFQLVINLKTAKSLGVIIEPSVLARANQLIE